MSQIGLNMGPRHARVLGWAKSFTRQLTQETMVKHDSDVIGGAAVVWQIIRGVIPDEVFGAVDDILKYECLPSLATQNVPTGK